jgi:hypothetical protein
VDALLEEGLPEGLTKGEVTTLGGIPVITVSDAEGTEYRVATVGEPYLLEIEFDGQFLEFADFDVPVTIEAPAESTDLLSLLGLG